VRDEKGKRVSIFTEVVLGEVELTIQSIANAITYID